jgi:hypothetical protein
MLDIVCGSAADKPIDERLASERRLNQPTQYSTQHRIFRVIAGGICIGLSVGSFAGGEQGGHEVR